MGSDCSRKYTIYTTNHNAIIHHTVFVLVYFRNTTSPQVNMTGRPSDKKAIFVLSVCPVDVYRGRKLSCIIRCTGAVEMEDRTRRRSEVQQLITMIITGAVQLL